MPAGQPSSVESKPQANPVIKPQAQGPRPGVQAPQNPPKKVLKSDLPADPADTQPSDDRTALAQRGADPDANRSREATVTDVPTELPGNDTAGEPDSTGATGGSRISPDDLPYFFLYNPSMKPL
jgi:hypothetical protein